MKYLLPLVALCVGFPLFLNAQNQGDRIGNPYPLSAFDQLKSSITVPEIDPRQYVIIYEWKAANEKRSRDRLSVSTEFIDSEINRYQKQLDNILLEMAPIKDRINLLDTAIKEGQKKRNEIEKQLDEIEEQLDEIEEQLDEILFQYNIVIESTEKRLIKEQQELRQKEEILLNQQETLLNQQETLSNQREITKSKTTENIETRDRVYEGIRPLQQKKSDLEQKIRRLKEQKNTERKRNTPIDYYETIGSEYPGNPDNYEEYYNYVFWRNAGTPQWEPIWWLNYYPWPNLDYRNIDLIDQDQRESNFALIPYQKYEVIDYQSTLRLLFDKNQLARNDNFKGSISLRAFLFDGQKANADTREIEVNPYSVIGKERRSIGLLNRPAKEIANYLIRFIVESTTLIKEGMNLPYYRSFFDYDDWELRNTEKIKNILEDLNSTIAMTDSIDWSKIKNYIDYIYAYDISNYVYLDALETPANAKDSLELKKAIDRESNQLQERINKKLKTQLDAYGDQLDDYRKQRRRLSLILDILKYFESEGGSTQMAFLRLIGKEKLTHEYHSRMFREGINNIDGVFSAIDTTKTGNSKLDINKIDSLINKLTTNFLQITETLYKLSDINGSTFFEALDKLISDEEAYDSMSSNDSFDHYNSKIITKLEYLFNNPYYLNQMNEYLAEKAGEILYQDLIYATIDLDLADAEAGDQLIIEMTWNKDLSIKDTADIQTSQTIPGYTPPRPSSNDGVVLYLAKFKLAKMGWSFKTNESAVLIKRIKENLLRTDYPLVPSNFSLTGGASIMWSYHNDHRINKRIKVHRKTSLPSFDKRGRLKYRRFPAGAQRFFKWLEPSFGLNINYVNFTTEESFELGVGPAIGLFNNLLFFSGGINLMETQERPYYFGVGFSFVNLGAKIEELSSTSSSN